MVFLDFAPLRHRQCADADFERWYARSAEGKECLMGHKAGPVTKTLDGTDELSNGISEGSLTHCATWVINMRIPLVMRRIVLARTRTTNGKLDQMADDNRSAISITCARMVSVLQRGPNPFPLEHVTRMRTCTWVRRVIASFPATLVISQVASAKTSKSTRTARWLDRPMAKRRMSL